MSDHFTYHQSTGELYLGDEFYGRGWAGNGEGKNNPAMQGVRGRGPIPQGWYTIGEPEEHPTVGHFAMRLTPDPSNGMFGRDGFLMHGPAMDPKVRGQESRGCPIQLRPVRERVHASGIKRLLVVA